MLPELQSVLFIFLALTTVQGISIFLIAILLFLGFRILETGWTYKISKPWQWEADIKAGMVPAAMQKLEKGYGDKVRFYTIWLLIRKLKNDSVAGAFAEVGVYRGETAKLIHAADDKRKLYLFDTFNGFSDRDLGMEKLNAENSAVDFSNTSEMLVRQFVQGNENVIFRTGYFPDTARDLDEKFAFVSLDADLYQPTLAGLRYFYPRLSAGGAIVIHDYNHSWDGIKKAVDEFIREIPETLVEVADWQGSAMIVKSKSLKVTSASG